MRPISGDGPRHYNSDRSEGLWGRGASPLEWRCATEPTVRTQCRTLGVAAECTKGRCKLHVVQGRLGAT